MGGSQTGSRFVATSDPARALTGLGLYIAFSDTPAIPLAGGKGYLLSVPEPKRVDLTSFIVVPPERRLGGEDGDEDIAGP